ncbi:acyltransferase [Chloroflexus aggregans]|uniref:Hexapaptide repeat-containing transferase n=1 Tax=Chloroflexus aggregans (strain MD-66 / DSM 9485) TaxID=326427 RepID=B8G5M7_CHLAD|nr:acyltransferase [Chloroflexus aggregans]ACL23738.1 hexapaptide repeat-containing transferase [Chloroflexus aggregans DSM 9485]
MRLYRTIIFLLLFIAPPPLKPPILRIACGAQIGRGVSIGWFTTLMGRHISIGDYSSIRALTIINCGGDLSIGRYSIISSFTLIYGADGLRIGDHCYIGPQSLINTEEEVRIGHWSALGARCMLYTHGSFLPYSEGYWVRFAPITIGNRVWCAAGVFLHPGITIGDNSFVKSRSVVSGEIPPDSIVEGNPARVINTMSRMQRTITPRRLDAIAEQMLRHFLALTATQGALRVWPDRSPPQVQAGRHIYQLVLVPATGEIATVDPTNPTIWLICRRGWSPPSALWLDLTTNRRSMHRAAPLDALCTFLQRYYGIQLEYEEER